MTTKGEERLRVHHTRKRGHDLQQLEARGGCLAVASAIARNAVAKREGICVDSLPPLISSKEEVSPPSPNLSSAPYQSPCPPQAPSYHGHHHFLLHSAITTSSSHSPLSSSLSSHLVMVLPSPYFSLARYTAGGGSSGAAAASAFLLRRPPFCGHPPLAHDCSSTRRSFPSFKPHPLGLALDRGRLPRATLSSFSSADDGPKPALEGKAASAAEAEEEEEGDQLPELAKAFNISSRTATAISVLIAVAALTLPLAMRPLAQVADAKTKALSYLTLLAGFYMAWNIGANDVANAMGTSVGSGALTLRQAVITAAVLEFSGAFLMGTHVTSTMQKGILMVSVFQGKENLLLAGLLSSLAAAGTWLQVASFYGWPVSTTHCIVGAMVGFGLVYGGIGAVFWSSLARVTSSWVISPLVGAAASFLVYKCIRRFVYSAANPGQAAAASAPIAVFLGVTGISFSAFPLSKVYPVALAQALACGTAGAVIVSRVIHKQLGNLLTSEAEKPAPSEKPHPQTTGFLADFAGPTGAQLEIVYGVFGYMQVLSACFMSFAHGANDVSNAIGPLAAALSIVHGAASSAAEIVIPTDVLAWGGFGIVAGLMIWGYRVIATIGKKITELTPTRGFAAEFAAASVVLVASKLGLPISATHTLVGAVMGVGFARGFNSVRAETVREIATSWAVTIPVGGLLSVVYTWVFIRLLSFLI
ncbi:inorganic phosphate transporter 2-1, chloroplastic [Canna indica]|uniref:Phosphate transporter n=1 Tax=Canna indica TaxID=4628 RepID=A0AAQ3JWN3_9LILI|nr:inorganic phosphate transporter 2-1, chloroplastic [Canna indica]